MSRLLVEKENKPKVNTSHINVSNVNIEKQIIDPTMAEYHLKYNQFPNQRRINQEHVNLLASEMLKGNFNPYTELTFIDYNDQLYLENGQHRLSAIVQSQTSQAFIVKTLTVPTYMDLAAIYSNEDINKTRTLHDMCRAFNLTDVTHLKIGQQSQLSAAIHLMNTKFSGFKKIKHSRVENMQAILYWSKYAEKYFAITQNALLIGSKMRLSAPLSIAIITFKYAPIEAQEFWTQVANGHITGVESRVIQNKPAIHLRNYLMMYNTKLIMANQSKSKTSVTKSFVNYIIACWNAFIEKKDLIYIKSDQLEKKFVIAKVPNLEEIYNLKYDAIIPK